MRIKGLVLLGVMIVVSLIYFLGGDFKCSNGDRNGPKPNQTPAGPVEKR